MYGAVTAIFMIVLLFAIGAALCVPDIGETQTLPFRVIDSDSLDLRALQVNFEEQERINLRYKERIDELETRLDSVITNCCP